MANGRSHYPPTNSTYDYACRRVGSTVSSEHPSRNTPQDHVYRTCTPRSIPSGGVTVRPSDRLLLCRGSEIAIMVEPGSTLMLMGRGWKEPANRTCSRKRNGRFWLVLPLDWRGYPSDSPPPHTQPPPHPRLLVLSESGGCVAVFSTIQGQGL